MQIKNLKFPPAGRAGKIKNYSWGFSLVELLIVSMVLITVGGIVVAIMSSALRGTNKTNNLIAVKQNGSSALLQMAKMLRTARSFDTISTSPFRGCVPVIPPPPTPTPTPVRQTSIGFTSFDGGRTTFDCTSGPPATITSNSASLLDTNAVSVVSGSCYFTCFQQNPLDFPQIGIRFSLTNKIPEGVASLFSEFTSQTIPFETTVVLRNRAIQ